MNDWLEKGKPGPKRKLRKRTTTHITVHPNVFDFLEEYKEENGAGSTGRLVDRLISSKFAIKIGDL